MPSTYTTNGGIELPANGEQSGTWGETVNDNMAIIDRLTNGVGEISLSGTTHTLTTADGTLSDGQYNVLVLGGSPSGTNTITISPNDGEHVYIVKNASGQTATFTQGSGASISVLNNTTKIIYADGAGAGAAVVDITGALDLGSLIIAGTSVTATAAELNILDGVTATAAELNLLDGSIAGTVVNSKAVIYGAAGQVEATTVEFDNLSGTGAVSVTNILDEDNMASDSATALATQQSIKAYVDAQVDTVDTLAEILAIGNTTGATDIAVDSAQKVQFRDAAIYINSSVDGQLDIVADTEIQIAATTVDLNGNLDVSGTTLVTGVLTTTAQAVFNGGFDGNAKATINTADGLSSDYALIITNGETTAGQNFGLRVRGGSNASDVAFTVETYDNANDLFRMYGNGQSSFHNGTVSLPSITNIGDLNTGMWFPADDKIAISTAGVERFRINDIGGVTFTSAAGGHAVFNENGVDADFRVESDTNANALIVDGATGNIGFSLASTPYGSATTEGLFYTAGAGFDIASNTNTLRVNRNSTGGNDRVNIELQNNGTTRAEVGSLGAENGFYLSDSTKVIISGYSDEVVINETGADMDFRVESDANANALFVEGSSGDVGIGVTADPSGTTSSTPRGQWFGGDDGPLVSTTYQQDAAVFNRLNNDGSVVSIRQAGVQEGNISVAGTTVSYNGGHLARWSQLADNTRDDTLLKGTVLTNLDQMAVWGDEDNEQLNCMAKSSVEGDANVAGVFVNWDNDDKTYSADMNIAMTGDMIIRIAQGTTVARGDLLMSAGDGTAKPQGDDIVRGKTIAKITSTHVTCTYDDGSYCVPCVLMAC
jgi:hypothetical protein